MIQNCYVYRYNPISPTCVIEAVDERDSCDRMINGIINRHYPIQTQLMGPNFNLNTLRDVMPYRLRGTGDEAKIWDALRDMYNNDRNQLAQSLSQKTLVLAARRAIQQRHRMQPDIFVPRRYGFMPYRPWLFSGGWFPIQVARPKRVMQYVPGWGIRTGTTYKNYSVHNVPITKTVQKADGSSVSVTVYVVCETSDGLDCYGKIYRIVANQPLDNDPVFCQNLRRVFNVK